MITMKRWFSIKNSAPYGLRKAIEHENDSACVQCRPFMLTMPLHELAWSEQGKYEEERNQIHESGARSGAL